MYTLAETWKINIGEPPVEDWDGEMVCLEMDAGLSFSANVTQGFSRHYSFTVVTQGRLTMLYNGHELTIQQNDLYIYSPGMSITIKDASDDYRSVCVLVDEDMTLELPIVRQLVSIAYQPIVQLSAPKVSLPIENARHLEGKIREMISYFNSDHIYKSQVLRMLYSVFLLDIQNIQERIITHRHVSQHIEELFIAFLRLLPLHFIEHHDIAFYADKIHVSTAYLSRIVKRVSGRTVVDYINQLLLMEASFLLQTTSLPVAQIAERLNFADTPSFSKFFSRLKGLSPREYRENFKNQ